MQVRLQMNDESALKELRTEQNPQNLCQAYCFANFLWEGEKFSLII